MKKSLVIMSITLFFLLGIDVIFHVHAEENSPSQWDFQSIDTMKYSRDLAREKLKDPSFDTEINKQMKHIKETGATYVAIGTPYDDEFLPILRRWVKIARDYHLKIWFRGNWSGWEGWFGYPKITPDDHLQKTEDFILKNKDLFEDGDVFTACPECENGGPGDPRTTHDVTGFRDFHIKEYEVAKNAFSKIHKKVAANFASMNADVARLTMDKETTKAMGGIVVIDHYTHSPEELRKDIDDLAKISGGKIILGEFGAPIPDLNGTMTPKEQANWVKKALSAIASSDSLIGVNYWVGFGGSTAIWEKDGTPRPAVSILTSFFTGQAMRVQLVDEVGYPVTTASLTLRNTVYSNEKEGYFQTPYIRRSEIATISANGFIPKELTSNDNNDTLTVLIHHKRKGLLLMIQQFFGNLFRKLSIEINTKR